MTPQEARARLGLEVRPWTERAACDGVDQDVFFLDLGGHRRPDAWARARSYCNRCPVRAECLADALAHEDPAHVHGFRGGLTPEQRRARLRGAAS